jgi:hypothetical protein
MLATIFNFPNILITQQKVMNVYQQEIINWKKTLGANQGRRVNKSSPRFFQEILYF